MVTFFLGPHYDFYIERKSIGNTLAVQVPCDVAPVYLKPALCIGELGGDFHVVDDEPVEYPGTDTPVQALRFFNMAFSHFS